MCIRVEEGMVGLHDRVSCEGAKGDEDRSARHSMCHYPDQAPGRRVTTQASCWSLDQRTLRHTQLAISATAESRSAGPWTPALPSLPGPQSAHLGSGDLLQDPTHDVGPEEPRVQQISAGAARQISNPTWVHNQVR